MESLGATIAISLLNVTLTSGTLYKLVCMEVMLADFKNRLEKVEKKKRKKRK